MAIAMSPDVIKRCLVTVPLLTDLAPADLDMLVASAHSVSFKKGARIFEEGSAADCCFVLTSGRARVVLAGRGGAEILLNILTPPALFGEIAVLDHSTRSASVVAADPCHVIRIVGAAFQSLRGNRAFEDRLVAGLLSMVRRSDDRVRVITSFPTEKRIAWCLSRVAGASGRREGSSIVIPKTPHQELAEMAGCTRETVSRVMQTLQEKKLVVVESQAMRIDIATMQGYLTTELSVPER